jgi:hypothetical protein
MKYQFCIRFNNIDANSAASKAVLDCNRIFSDLGYRDFTFTVGDNSKKLPYYFSLLKQLIKFIFSVKSGSIVGIQYPLLSINSVFKYFIWAAKLKNIKFFCVVHDLESLRTGGKDAALIHQEIENLSAYDTVIVHNQRMQSWLKDAGVTVQMLSLELFDYLSGDLNTTSREHPDNAIVYAGNLSKSTFIYSLSQVKQQFNVFGPNYKGDVENNHNIQWMGEFSPEEIPQKLNGKYGLIWDGSRIDVCDEILGNYLKYNNPHKCSLYIAAGLPIIAPGNSAIAQFIKKNNIGILIESLHDLDKIGEHSQDYLLMKKNVLALREKVVTGAYFNAAIKQVEKIYGIQ